MPPFATRAFGGSTQKARRPASCHRNRAAVVARGAGTALPGKPAVVGGLENRAETAADRVQPAGALGGSPHARSAARPASRSTTARPSGCCFARRFASAATDAISSLL
ncbi:hypothetical protein BLA24064_06143 [Burkholderia latens]|uniref:Uncharacterized protein n=1 Tax=Burkholderia latens TaxID=488446 RepID=A0A6P2RAC5_9BURK|nr:hypothetical protein BLA24064_06143 [Burkholderia latens]